MLEGTSHVTAVISSTYTQSLTHSQLTNQSLSPSSCYPPIQSTLELSRSDHFDSIRFHSIY